MSIEAILDAIEASGQAEMARLRAETEARVQKMMMEAASAASARHEEMRRAALAPATGERARRLHTARLEALRAVSDSREQLIEAALTEIRRRLTSIRADPAYPVILRCLTEEVIGVLGDEGAQGSQCRLEADPRDAAPLRRILRDLDLEPVLTLSLNSWGGVVARSADGLIVATNTLEARLERARPFLRRGLARQMENESREAIAQADPFHLVPDEVA